MAVDMDEETLSGEEALSWLEEDLRRSAEKEATLAGHSFLGTEHLFLALLAEPRGLAEREVTAQGLQPLVVRSQILLLAGGREPYRYWEGFRPTPRLLKILHLARGLEASPGEKKLTPAALLAALYQEAQGVAARVLRQLGFDLSRALANAQAELVRTQEVKPPAAPLSTSPLPSAPETPPPLTPQAPAPVSGEERLLAAWRQHLLRDFTELARNGQLRPVAGREQEIAEVQEILGRLTRNKPLLVGPPGVGKTAIVEGLAWQIVLRPDGPSSVRRVLGLSCLPCLGEPSDRERFAYELASLTETLTGPSTLLFLDDFHAALAPETPELVRSVCRFLVQREDIPLIIAVRDTIYARAIAGDEFFELYCRPLPIAPPGLHETHRIALSHRNRWMEHYGVRLTETVVKLAVDLAAQALPQRLFPLKAVELLDEACARTQADRLRDGKPGFEDPPLVSETTVREIAADWSGQKEWLSLGDWRTMAHRELARLERQVAIPGVRLRADPLALEFLIDAAQARVGSAPIRATLSAFLSEPLQEALATTPCRAGDILLATREGSRLTFVRVGERTVYAA